MTIFKVHVMIITVHTQLVNHSMAELLCSQINLGGFQKGRGYL